MKISTIFILCTMFVSLLSAQTKQQITQQATKQLSTMTPEQIDAKIKESGMTRAEAEAKAKENGIDLQAYLRGAAGSTAVTLTSETGSKKLIQSGPIAGVATEAVNTPVTATRTLPISRGLQYFGYDVFSRTPASFEPSAGGPIDPDYIIGPEDVLRVSMWGQVEQQNELTVDKEGRIFIPSAGPVVVTGMTVDEVNKTLTKQLSRSIQGLSATPKTVWLDVTLAKIRPKRIFIMGEVNNPGGYTVNSYATIFNSLFAVGGPTINGSLREVRLIRANKIIAKIDLYLYLTGSEKNNDVRVQNNDIIYVPVRKNSISIKGEVRKPAIYELLPGENLKKLLEYSGGNLPTSYLERVQVERILPLKDRLKNELERRYIDINYREIIAKNSDYTLVDDDFITFYSVLDEVKNFVTISGSVYKPGTYQLTSNMKLKDLIQLADSLKPETYFARGELTRVQKENRSRITIPFDLKALIAGDQSGNIVLEPKDEVLIHTLDVSRVSDDFVEIFGSVKKPGKYFLSRNMTLVDVLMLAEGYTENSFRLQAQIARLDVRRNSDTLSYINISTLPDLTDTVNINSFAFFENYRKTDFCLQHRDQIFVRENPNFQIQQIVSILGEVKYPGQYALILNNEFVSDLIQRAGGLKSSAYPRGGILMRGSERVNSDIKKMIDNPKSSDDIILHPADNIIIPKKPNSVKISGQVNNSGILGFKEGDMLWDYIDRAGGLDDSAGVIVLFHPNGNAEKFRTGWFGGNTKIEDGSTIFITKVATEPPEKPSESIGTTIKDIFAIVASAFTIMVLAKQI